MHNQEHVVGKSNKTPRTFVMEMKTIVNEPKVLRKN